MERPSKLLIVNPTPAVQRRLRFAKVTWNDVNRAQEVEVLPSGKGLNCARAARRLEAEPEVLLYLGGSSGRWLRETAEAEGISVRAVEVSAPTRTCITLLDKARGAVTELVENAAPVEEKEAAAFEQAFADAAAGAEVIIFIGTLPQGLGEDFYGRLLRRVPEKRVLVDTQGSVLTEALAGRPWLVKPNRQELAAATGLSCDSSEDVQRAVAKLHEAGAQNVLVTDGPRAAWFSDARELRWLSPARVEAKNPIGSGDSVAAGIAVASLGGAGLLEAVQFGLLCGSANAAGEGYGRLNLDVLRAGALR